MRWILLLFFPFGLLANNILTVGMELDYPPFETIDKKGSPMGISVDLANSLGDYLKKKTVIKNIPYIGLIPALKTEKIDCIISSMTITEERRKSVDFSIPYVKSGLCLLISQKSDLEDISQADEKGRVIVVKKGTTGELWAGKHLKKAKVLILDLIGSAILEVVQGKADAFIYDPISVFNAHEIYPGQTRMNLHPFEVSEWGIAVREGDPLLEQINAFLIKFKENEGFEKLGEKYLKKQMEAFKQMGIPFFL